MAVFVAARDAAEIDRAAASSGLALDPSVRAQLAAFAELVARWNDRLNLVGAKTAPAVAEVLLDDALVLASRDVVPEGASIVDVGSGAGAPALPLLVARADLRATLVEPRRKRVAFLRTAIGSLGLEARAAVVEATIDPAAPSATAGTFDFSVSRATFPPPEWVVVGLALAPRCAVLLGEGARPEPPAGARLVTSRRYRLHASGTAREVAVYERLAPREFQP